MLEVLMMMKNAAPAHLAIIISLPQLVVRVRFLLQNAVHILMYALMQNATAVH